MMKKIQILSMAQNVEQTQFGVLFGHSMSEYEKECFFVQIYKLTDSEDDDREWTLFKHIVLNKELRSICHHFQFKTKEADTLIFTNMNFIYEFNFTKQRIRNIYEFTVGLNC